LLYERSPITVPGSRDEGCEVDILPLPQCSLTLCCPNYSCEFQQSYPNSFFGKSLIFKVQEQLGRAQRGPL